MYRPPINPGWDDLGERILQGVQAGLGLYQQGRSRREERKAQAQAQKREDEERSHQRARERRQDALQAAQLGRIEPEQAFTRLPSVGGVLGIPVPSGAPQLGPGVTRVGNEFFDPTRAWSVTQERARGADQLAQRGEQLRQSEEEEYGAALRRIAGAGITDPREAARLATRAVHGVRFEDEDAAAPARPRARSGGRRSGGQAEQERLEASLAREAAAYFMRHPDAPDSTDPFMAGDLPYRALGNQRVREVITRARSRAAAQARLRAGPSSGRRRP